MKVWFETMGGTQFPVEVGDSGTLQEMQEQVEVFLEIPISRQILYFRGNILRSDDDILGVKEDSVIHFKVIDEPSSFPFPAPEPEAAGELTLQLEISPTQTATLIASAGDTIRELKENIESIWEGTSADLILITTADGTEIPDFRRLLDYAISFSTGVTVENLGDPAEPARKKSRLSVMSSSNSSSYSSSTPRMRSRLSMMSSSSSKKLSRLSVMSPAASSSSTPPPLPPLPVVEAEDESVIRLVLEFRGERLAAPVEVRRASVVGVLRARLKEMNFKVVPESRGYCFFHKLIQLDEERSFAWQKVANGDLIVICSPKLTKMKV